MRCAEPGKEEEEEVRLARRRATIWFCVFLPDHLALTVQARAFDLCVLRRETTMAVLDKPAMSWNLPLRAKEEAVRR